MITYPFSRERVGKQYVELLTGFRSVTKRQQFSERWFINSTHGGIVTPEKQLFQQEKQNKAKKRMLFRHVQSVKT